VRPYQESTALSAGALRPTFRGINARINDLQAMTKERDDLAR
jgi:hypothetical protein